MANLTVALPHAHWRAILRVLEGDNVDVDEREQLASRLLLEISAAQAEQQPSSGDEAVFKANLRLHLPEKGFNQNIDRIVEVLDDLIERVRL